ncbi:HK97-gp10 family putative phage morphogenesis protein [Aeoliella sp.]|uniref:HK97-gp10 family putative phage morphogenesis protein n=1 Tax=Aeoliella sp. TaxID=2795800 RepID=UPI003CCBE1AA
MRFDLQGDKKLIKKLEKLAAAEQKKAIRKASRAGNKILLQASKKEAKKSKDTGAFLKSLKVRSIPRSRVWVGTKVVSVGLRYSSMLELGTKNTGAKEHLTDAAKANDDKALKKATEIIKEEIEKSMKRP